MICKATQKDLPGLAALAAELWPHHPASELEREFAPLVCGGEGVCFLALDGGLPVGFAQAGLRRDYVEGTSGSPVGYLEGIYVQPAFRGNGYARALLQSCQQWAKEKGCREFASDCELDNTGSLGFHLAAGFAEANRIICFVKQI